MTDTFMADIDIPKYSKSAGNPQKFSPMMFMKPNAEGEFYRFRLLKIDGSQVGRDYPFIVRHIHDHWAVNDKGYKIPDDSVTCLKTAYVDYPKSRKYTDCPMCNHAVENFNIWKSSGYKDPVSGGKFNSMKEKYQFIFPVFVVNDPNNPKNNGHMKTLMFTKKSLGKKDVCRDELCADDFERIIREEISKAKASAATGNPYTIWNGKHAVDLCVIMEERPIVYHRGEPNEYTYNQKVITNMWFTKEAYDVQEITKEKIEALDFDQFYTSSTPAEIEAFYRKYYLSGASNVPKEKIEIPPAPSKKVEQPQVSTQNTSVQTTRPAVDIGEIDDLLPSEEPTKPTQTSSSGFVDPLSGIDLDKDLDDIIDM